MMGWRNSFDFTILPIPIGLVGVFLFLFFKILYSVEAFVRLGKWNKSNKVKP